MSLMRGHLEQIAFSCEGIDSLPFPPPRIFTNGLLSNHDITSLLRDTEPHERALFSVPPPPPAVPAPCSKTLVADREDASSGAPKRRQTVFNVSSGEVTTAAPPKSRTRRTAAVAAILGPQMHDTLTSKKQRRESKVGGTAGDVDVEILLKGAEKLCGVYELPGALSRIQELRSKWTALGATLVYYEGKVAEQAQALEAMNREWRDNGDFDGDFDGEETEAEGDGGGDILTLEELRAEEEDVRELEGRKRELQERLRAMEKDIGGLMGM